VGENEEGKDPVELLAGTSLKVYLYLLTRGGYVGVRELQRAMGFKSPSTARHHLDRLAELGILEKTSRGYKARPPKGILAEFYNFRGRLLPKASFLSAFLAASTITYALLPGADPVAIVVLGVATLIEGLYTLHLYKAIRKLMASGRG
jgi:DNA-binding transcriptional ArsR family regulator